MGMKDCNNCDNEVPKAGQCNSCGFVDGMARQPSDEEFKDAREINDKHEY